MGEALGGAVSSLSGVVLSAAEEFSARAGLAGADTIAPEHPLVKRTLATENMPKTVRRVMEEANAAILSGLNRP